MPSTAWAPRSNSTWFVASGLATRATCWAPLSAAALLAPICNVSETSVSVACLLTNGNLRPAARTWVSSEANRLSPPACEGVFAKSVSSTARPIGVTMAT